MPLFTKKFEPKATPLRGQRRNHGCPAIKEDLNDYKDIKLNLGDKELKFVEGIWLHTSVKGDVDDVTKINRKLKTLEEENNLNQVKIDVLLDMLTENISELNLLREDSNN